MQKNFSELLMENKNVVFVSITVLVGLYYLNTSSWVFRPSSIEDVRRWVKAFGSFGPLVYIALYAVRTFLFFPSLLLNLSAGVLFGPWWGTIYLIMGGLANASVCFWFARMAASRQSLLKRFGGRWGERLDNYFSDENGLAHLLWLRMVPIFPYDPVSVVAGSSSMKYVPYAVITAIGMLPGAIAYNFLADSFVGKTIGVFEAFIILFFAFGIPLLWWYVSDERKRL